MNDRQVRNVGLTGIDQSQQTLAATPPRGQCPIMHSVQHKLRILELPEHMIVELVRMRSHLWSLKASRWQ